MREALMSFRVYVTAPYEDARAVRRIHSLLRYLRLEPTSSWVDEATAPEALDALPVEELRRRAQRNDDDLESSSAILVLPRHGAGREMFAEARVAIDRHIPVVWVGGPRSLSAYRDGVVRVEDLMEGLAHLCELAAWREQNMAALGQILKPHGIEVPT